MLNRKIELKKKIKMANQEQSFEKLYTVDKKEEYSLVSKQDQFNSNKKCLTRNSDIINDTNKKYVSPFLRKKEAVPTGFIFDTESVINNMPIDWNSAVFLGTENPLNINTSDDNNYSVSDYPFQIKCLKCNVFLQSQTDVIYHNTMHLYEKYGFKNVDIMRFCKDKRVMECILCSEKLVNNEAFSNHLLTPKHKKRQLLFNVNETSIKKISKELGIIKYRVKEVVEKERDVITYCNICSDVIRFRGLTVHLVGETHQNNLPTNLNSLTKYKSVKDVSNFFSCFICNQEINSKSKYLKHMFSTIHNHFFRINYFLWFLETKSLEISCTDNKIHCLLCDTTFVNILEAANHSISVHSMQPLSLSSQVLKCSFYKKYQSLIVPHNNCFQDSSNGESSVAANLCAQIDDLKLNEPFKFNFENQQPTGQKNDVLKSAITISCTENLNINNQQDFIVANLIEDNSLTSETRNVSNSKLDDDNEYSSMSCKRSNKDLDYLNEYKCTRCNIFFKNKSNVIYHNTMHFYERYGLKNVDIMRFCEDKKMMECLLCSEKLENSEVFSNHLLTSRHLERLLLFEVVNNTRKFHELDMTPYQVKGITNERDVKSYCNTCSEIVRFREVYDHAKTRIHKKKLPKNFTPLTVRKKIKDDSNIFLCFFCNREFKDQKNFLKHMFDITGEHFLKINYFLWILSSRSLKISCIDNKELVECLFCSAIFLNIEKAAEHSTNVHSIQPLSLSSSFLKSSLSIKYQNCIVSFSQSLKNLNNGERPVEANLCAQVNDSKLINFNDQQIIAENCNHKKYDDSLSADIESFVDNNSYTKNDKDNMTSDLIDQDSASVVKTQSENYKDPSLTFSKDLTYFIQYKCLRCNIFLPEKSNVIYHNILHFYEKYGLKNVDIVRFSEDQKIMECLLCSEKLENFEVYSNHLLTPKHLERLLLFNINEENINSLDKLDVTSYQPKEISSEHDVITWCTACSEIIKFHEVTNHVKKKSHKNNLPANSKILPKNKKRLRDKSNRFFCFFCSKELKSQQDFLNHMFDVTGKHFVRMNYFLWMLNAKSLVISCIDNKEFIECLLCNAIFLNIEKAANHYSTAHSIQPLSLSSEFMKHVFSSRYQNMFVPTDQCFTHSNSTSSLIKTRVSARINDSKTSETFKFHVDSQQPMTENDSNKKNDILVSENDQKNIGSSQDCFFWIECKTCSIKLKDPYEIIYHNTIHVYSKHVLNEIDVFQACSSSTSLMCLLCDEKLENVQTFEEHLENKKHLNRLLLLEQNVNNGLKIETSSDEPVISYKDIALSKSFRFLDYDVGTHCKLCNKFIPYNNLVDHKNGKKHQVLLKKMNIQWLEENNDNPKTRKRAIDKSDITGLCMCFICNKRFQNRTNLLIHFDSKRHRNKFYSYQRFLKSDSLKFSMTWQVSCSICKSFSNSFEEAMEHLSCGKKLEKFNPQLAISTEEITPEQDGSSSSSSDEGKDKRMLKNEQRSIQNKNSVVKVNKIQDKNKYERSLLSSLPNFSDLYIKMCLENGIENIYTIDSEFMNFFQLSINLTYSYKSNNRQSFRSCIICAESFLNNLCSLYDHLLADYHVENLNKLKSIKEPATCLDQLNDLDLASSFIRLESEEYLPDDIQSSYKCYLCDLIIGNEVNNEVDIKDHINSKNHLIKVKQLRDETDEINERFKKIFHNSWYYAEKYSCDICNNSKFKLEFDFAKHLKTSKHLDRVYKFNCKGIKVKFYLCPFCSSFSFSDSVDPKCNKRHRSLLKRFANIDPKLPRTVVNFLHNIEKKTGELVGLSNNVAKNDQEVTEDLLQDIEYTVQTVYPNARAYAFGSRMSHVGLPNSDVDVFLDCDNVYTAKASRKTSLQYFNSVESYFKKNNHIWRINQVLKSPRIPIIKLQHLSSRLNCDVSFTNGLGVEKSKLLRNFNKAFPLCREMIIFLKKWFHLAQLSGSFRINSYALSWLVIFYLQIINVFPRVFDLVDKVTENTVGGWNCNFKEKIPINSKDQMNIKKAINNFFSYYANFDFKMYVICPWLGKVVKKEIFVNLENLPEEMYIYKELMQLEELEHFRFDSPMCIQDPVDLSQNITKGVKKRELRMLKNYCNESSEIITK